MSWLLVVADVQLLGWSFPGRGGVLALFYGDTNRGVAVLRWQFHGSTVVAISSMEVVHNQVQVDVRQHAWVVAVVLSSVC